MPTFSVLFFFSWSESELQSQIFFIFAKLWIILIPIYWIYRIEESRLSLGEINSKGMYQSIVSGILIFLAVGIIFLIFGDTLDVDLMKQEIGGTGLLNPHIFVLGVFYWITVNILEEEFVFLQFIGDRIVEFTGRESVAVLLSAAIFTLHHTVLLGYYFEPWQNVISSIGIFIAERFGHYCGYVIAHFRLLDISCYCRCGGLRLMLFCSNSLAIFSMRRLFRLIQ